MIKGAHMKNKDRKILVLIISIIIGVVCLIGCLINNRILNPDRRTIFKTAFKKTTAKQALEEGLNIKADFLDVNKYSRPGKELNIINNIVIHYVCNPGSTAKQNRDYFEGLATSGETYASSHYIVGIDGEIIQCIPLNEISYCSNNRNNDTISIEVCHSNADGKFADATYNSLIKLCAWLCNAYKLNSEDLIRHYDITGKICPKYYVDHPDAWKNLKKDVKKKM